MSKMRNIAAILGRTEAANIDNNPGVDLDDKVADSSVVSSILAGSTMAVYSSVDSLPGSPTAGSQAFVIGNQRLYTARNSAVGSGWYNVALINATPTLSLSASGTIALAAGSATIITMTAVDSDNSNANLTLSLESGGDLFKFATVSRDSSVVTITPRTQDSATALGSDGSATLTFKASDGISQATVQNTFTLSFGPDWTGSFTRSTLAPSPSPGNFNQINAGASVAISADGNYVASGAPADGSSGNTGGSVYIYVKSGSTWSQQQKIQASDNNAGDYLGDRVEMNSDGTYLIAGAWYDDANSTNSGASYIFTRSGTTWSQQAKLDDRTGGSHNAGRACAISSDGSYAAFGSNSNTSDAYSTTGSVTVFTRSGTSWSVQQKFQPTDIASSDLFGIGVAMSDDATDIAAAAYNQNSSQGSVYVWTRSGTSWTQQAKLTASDGAANDNLGTNNGHGVDISGDGNYVVAGAENHNSNGAAYVWVRSGSSWTQQAKLTASDGEATDRFGHCVRINENGSQIIVVAHLEDTGGSNRGSAYIFTRSGTSWSETAILRNNTSPVSGRMEAAAINANGNAIVTGVINNGVAGTNVGAAYVYDLD